MSHGHLYVDCMNSKLLFAYFKIIISNLPTFSTNKRMLSVKCHKCYAEPPFSLNIKVEGRGAHIKGGGGRPPASLTFLLQD